MMRDMERARTGGRRPRLDRDGAMAVAAQAAAFLAEDEDRLARFLALTGLSPETLRAGLAQPAMLGAVLDHLLSDEPLLLAFAEAAGLPPELPAAARALLP